MKFDLSETQVDAVREIVRNIKKWGEKAPTPYGAGSYPLIRMTTATALRDLGLVSLHSVPTSRPARAGFGKPPNWRTVWTANRWMEATPKFLQAMADAKAAKGR
jgi:hypothetical protein